MPATDVLAPLLPRLEALLGPASGEVQPVDGGITNRNFRLTLGGRDCVVRVCGKNTGALGIDRHQRRRGRQQLVVDIQRAVHHSR